MNRRTLILGTAGHVDHGKTTLVRALTGTDTDRLQEEHRRGISIELGFAHLELADDVRVGVVDVPGHERFVRQMVAGAGGMDLAMLLVAADEGVMPQTREHFDVLRLLNVRTGLIVLTKTDLADPDLREVVREEVMDLVEGSFLEDAPVVDVSAETGAGLDELKSVLLDLARSAPEKGRSGDFRVPIDRVFAMPGAGVVITGTAWSGAVKVGDSLRLLPEDRSVRVREVQSHGENVNEAFAGARVALALNGAKKDEVARGDALVSGRCMVGIESGGGSRDRRRSAGQPRAGIEATRASAREPRRARGVGSPRHRRARRPSPGRNRLRASASGRTPRGQAW